jgi:hypothetical protein
VDVEEFDSPSGPARLLEATDVSAVLTALDGTPVIVERAMYLSRGSETFVAGHESAGVTAPATNWFLAEGATGDYFDLFILIANPTNDLAQVRATYLLPDGSIVQKDYPVAPNSRFNVWVDLEDTLLADTAVSAQVTSRNGVPIIVERSMWWPGSFGGWQEGHNAPGSAATGITWVLAEGEVGGPPVNTQTYYLIANMSPTAAQVKVTLLFDDGSAPVSRTFELLPRSRYNVDVRHEFPEAEGHGFGALIESLGPSFAQLVVERAMYNDAGGRVWAAGSDALGTRLQ